MTGERQREYAYDNARAEQGGLMDAAEADAAAELSTDPRLCTLSPVMMAAWGRRA